MKYPRQKKKSPEKTITIKKRKSAEKNQNTKAVHHPKAIKKGGELPLCLSLASFLISSAAWLLIPLVSFQSKGIALLMAFLPAGLFWLGLIAGILLHFLSGRQRRKITRAKRGVVQVFAQYFTRFFQNRFAMAADILLGLSAVGVALVAVLFSTVLWGWVIVFCLLALSLELHGVFNGENFIYMINQKNK